MTGYMRFAITARNGKTYPMNAVSEKQAWFFFRDMCKVNKINPTGAALTRVSCYYPGDVFAVWSVDNKQFFDKVA
jgi:hypothetical protein